MEKFRENVGFIIIASKKTAPKEEIVLGFNPSNGQYVTWYCIGGRDYNWGHYGDDFLKAVEDYKRRCRCSTQ